MDQNRDFVSQLCDLEIPGNIKISPSGERVLYSTSLTWGHLKGKLPVTTLWLATLGEAKSSSKITEGVYNDRCIAWHPIRDEFAFVSDRAGNATKSAIYTISLTNIGQAVPLTPTENEQAIEMFKFSPDGKMIAFISKDEKTEAERQREERREDVQVWGEGYRYSRLRVIDLETDQTSTLMLEQHVLDLCWMSGMSEESEEPEIAFVSCKNTLIERPYRFGTEIRIVQSDLEQSRQICVLPNRANDLSWGSMNFGESEELYFWSTSPMNKNFAGSALYKVDIKGDSCEYEQVILGDNQDDVDITAVQSVDGYIVAKAQHRLEDCLLWAGTEKLYSCKQEIEACDVAFGFSEGEVRLAIATSDVNHPVEVYSKRGGDVKMVQLSQHGESFQEQNFGICTILSCPTTDHYNIEIDGIYLQPVFKAGDQSETALSKPYPTVVLIHGGPRARVTNAFNTLYYMWTPYLLSLGYGVLLPNYRGSSGRGAEFSSFSYGGIGVHDYADIITLTQYAIKTGHADPDRLVVGGYSHGGLLANLCTIRNRSHEYGWEFKAVISGASISDIDTMSLTADMSDAYQAELHEDASPWTMSADDASTRTASVLWAFKEAMARSNSDRSSVIPPMLILHGANDQRCHISQAQGLRRALEYYSLPFEMVVYPRQGHIFHEQYFWIDMALRMGRWVEQHIGPGTSGPSNDTSKFQCIT